jgi:hypothetical protein
MRAVEQNKGIPMSVAHLTQRLSHVLTISNILGSKGLVLLLYQSVSLASIMLLLSRQGSSPIGGLF